MKIKNHGDGDYMRNKIYSERRRKIYRLLNQVLKNSLFTKLIQKDQKYQNLEIDTLTGVYNQFAINQFLKELHPQELTQYGIILLNIDNFSKGDDFKRYALLVTYVAVKLSQSRAYWLLLKVIYKKNLDGYDKKYNINFNEFKKSLLSILLDKNIDPLFITLRSMHMNFVTGMLIDEEVLIPDSDIQNFLFDSFKDALKSENDEEKLKVWLHNCADKMETGSRKIILNDECAKAYRNHVISKPEWYIKHFVFLDSVSSNPDWNSIACDGFWNQIFESDASVEKFIESCKAKNIEGADVASNFWELYMANDFNPIEFQNQGNVQEKLDNKLTAEIAMLNQLRAIEKDVSEVPESKEGLNSGMLTKHLQTLSESQNKLDSINLCIRLNEQIREEIERKKSSLS